jgi:competence protein CoiA
MHCCPSPAVPKTSINGFPFFAHYADECNSAPETIWHLDAKELVALNLSNIGIQCEREKDGKPLGWNWVADVYFVFDGRQIVVELQHSYQHLEDYQRRQKLYRECGVECYWLLYEACYSTVLKAMRNWYVRNELGGKFPKKGIAHPALMRDVPIALLDTDNGNVVRGAHLNVTVRGFLTSITEKRFSWRDGAWFISTP